MRRVIVMGQTCAGKSTVAGILARRLGLPPVEVDAIHWSSDPPWTPRGMEEKRRLVAEVAAGEAWILDGYSAFMREALLGRAEFLVWLDPPIRTSALRIVPRTFRRWWRGTPVCGGNRERPWRLFDRDGLLRYLRRTGRANAEKYAAAFAEFGAAGAETLRFGSTAEAVAWAKGLRLSR